MVFLFFFLTILIEIQLNYQLLIRLNSNQLTNDYAIEWSSSLSSLPFHLPTMKLCFGTPNNQCFDLTLMTISSHTILNNNSTSLHLFNSSQSSTFVDGRNLLFFSSNNKTITGHTVNDVIGIPQLGYALNDSFTFLLSPNLFAINQLNIDGYIGLHKFYDPQTVFHHTSVSFVEFLHRNHLIPTKSFTLNYTQEGGTIEFGKHNNHYRSCKTSISDILNQDWDCLVKKVSFGNKEMDLFRIKALFNSVSSLIIAPKQMKQFILDYVRDIVNSPCLIIEEEARAYLKCNKETFLNELPDITLQLGEDIAFLLKWKNLFSLSKDHFYLSTFVVELLNDNLWKIGLPGFMDNSIQFNNEDLTIGIVPQSIHFKKHQAQFFVLLLLLIMEGAGILTLCVKKIKK